MSVAVEAPSTGVPRTAGTSLILLWALELGLARITSDAIPLADVATSAVLLVLLPLAGLVGLARTPLSGANLAIAAGILGSLPLFLVASGIVLPVALRFAGTSVALAVFAALASVVAAGVQRSRSGGAPLPGPGQVLGVLSASAATAWVLQPTGFPPYQIAIPFLIVSVGCARLAMREDRMPALTAIGVALALWPAVLPPFPWLQHQVEASGPDLILVSVDSLRLDAAVHLDSYQELAKQGLTFTNVRASEAPDAPQVIELLTGVAASLPAQAGAMPGVAATVATVAERLRDSGYDTAAAVGPDPYAGLELGNYRGFAVYHHVAARNAFALPRWRENLRSANERERCFAARPVAADFLTWIGLTVPPIFGDADSVVSIAGRIMAERRSQPIFLWLHLVDPQPPYAHANEIDLPHGVRHTLATAPHTQLAEDRSAAETAYRNELRHGDEALLQFFRAVDKEAKRPTVIVLTGTRGESLFGAPPTSGGTVPLVLRGLPHTPAGTASVRPVRLLDIAPTLLIAAGASHDGLPGTDLAAQTGDSN